MLEEKVAPQQQSAECVCFGCVRTPSAPQHLQIPSRSLSYSRASTSKLRVYTVMGVNGEWPGDSRTHKDRALVWSYIVFVSNNTEDNILG